MTRSLPVLGALLLGFSSHANAQIVERQVRAPTNKEVRIGVYLNVQSDCSSGPLPTIRLTTPPLNGKVTVKRARVNGTNYKQCLALEVPGFVALYQSAPNFIGADKLTLEVKYANGRTETQNFTVTVGTGTQEQKI